MFQRKKMDLAWYAPPFSSLDASLCLTGLQMVWVLCPSLPLARRQGPAPVGVAGPPCALTSVPSQTRHRPRGNGVRCSTWTSRGKTRTIKNITEPRLGGWSLVLYTDRKVVGSMPRQNLCLGCGFDPWSEHVWEATD